LEWCLEMGVKIATVFAFSIDNFKRSTQEVEELMDLAKRKFTQMLQHGESIDRLGVSVRVLGDMSFVDQELQQVISNAVNFSKHNTQLVLNICFSYTSQYEWMNAACHITQAVLHGHLRITDINEDVLRQSLYTGCLGEEDEPDLLIRTSGETRLSDFLLFQSCRSCVSFFRAYWPEFSFWHFTVVILQYQRQRPHLMEQRKTEIDTKRRREDQLDKQAMASMEQQQNKLEEEEEEEEAQNKNDPNNKSRDKDKNKNKKHKRIIRTPKQQNTDPTERLRLWRLDRDVRIHNYLTANFKS